MTVGENLARAWVNALATLNVCFWPFADIPASPVDVRFRGQSRHCCIEPSCYALFRCKETIFPCTFGSQYDAHASISLRRFSKASLRR